MVRIANIDDANVEPDCTVVDPLGDDTINLGTGEYTLTTPIDGTPDHTDGDLEVDEFGGDNTLTIVGQGRANTIIDGGDHDRIFEVSGATFRLEDLTVRDGQAPSLTSGGGGILSTASVQLESVVVTENRTVVGGSGAGGGILMSGSSTLTLSNSTVEKNIADLTGGGIELRQSASLTTAGAATIGGDTPAEGNTAASQGGGINMSTLPGGDITLNAGATVDNNNAVALGGGIAHTVGLASSDLEIEAASVTNNDVTESAGGLASGGGIHYAGLNAAQTFTVSDGSTISNNTATGDEATGAGINATTNAGSFSITRSTVSNNTTTVQDDMDDPELEGGGGITLTGIAPSTITETTVRDNLADVDDPEDIAAGGAIRNNATLTIDSSTLADNTVQGGDDDNVNNTPRGAGLYAASPQGPTQVINSTFSGNAAVAGTGGSIGGGLVGFITTHPLTVAHTTFVGNSAGPGDNPGFGDAMNVGGDLAGNPNNLTLRGLVIDEGTDGCSPASLLEDPNGYNVDAGTSCVGAVNSDTDLKNAAINLDPGLSPNGGPTFTHALLAGSPAIDFVPTAQCLNLASAPLTVDQRGAGFPRPEGAACDAGAFEAQDTDNDGVVDVNDNCPAEVGPASNGGCPLPATTPTTPTTTPPATTPAPAKKKCKKGRKLKKGKCVKKKRKKRR
jgi:hypothetical protein